VSKPRTAVIDELLEEVWDEGGTDLLLTAGAPPLIRVDGELFPLRDRPPLSADDVKGLVQATLSPAQFTKLRTEREVDFSFTYEDTGRCRGSAFHQRGSMAMTLRLIPLRIPTFSELGLPPVVEHLAGLPSGLVLVTGPTGAGKSTSLASIIDHINHNRSCHILTIEEPVEYLHSHGLSAVNQREVGDDSESFARALRSALREDPDVLLVGEMRDLESIQTTLTIAETGHLVFATLHTNDTSQALDRIIDVFPSDRHPQIRVQLAASLSAVIYQRLLPRVGGGLVAAFEVMIANSAVRNLIREGKNQQLRNVVSTHQSESMNTLESCLSGLVRDGVISYETAVSASLHPKEIERPAPVAPVAANGAASGAAAPPAAPVAAAAPVVAMSDADDIVAAPTASASTAAPGTASPSSELDVDSSDQPRSRRMARLRR
jgi:twitching motility protein PilT